MKNNADENIGNNVDENIGNNEKLMHYKWFVSVMEGNQHNDNSKNNVDENIRNNVDENNENNGNVDAL